MINEHWWRHSITVSACGCWAPSSAAANARTTATRSGRPVTITLSPAGLAVAAIAPLLPAASLGRAPSRDAPMHAQLSASGQGRALPAGMQWPDSAPDPAGLSCRAVTRPLGQRVPKGSARIQHAVRKLPETTGINRSYRTQERGARHGRLAARCGQDRYKKPQVSGLTIALQELPGHDEALDLVGALVDRGDLGVAHHPLDRVVLDVAVATEQLDRVGGDLHGGVRGEALGRRIRRCAGTWPPTSKKASVIC